MGADRATSRTAKSRCRLVDSVGRRGEEQRAAALAGLDDPGREGLGDGDDLGQPVRRHLDHDERGILTPEHQAALTKMQHTIYRRYLATLTEGADAGLFRRADPVTTAFAIISRLTPEEIPAEYVRLALRMAGAHVGRRNPPTGN